MGSPQIFGEECNSSESGWTMYIGSPLEEDEDENDSYLNSRITNEEFNEDDERNYDDISDDSMVSDASSGPSHRGQSWEVQKGVSSGRGRGRETSQYCKDIETKKNVIIKQYCSSNYKSKSSSMKKNRNVKGNEEKVEHEINSAKGDEFMVHGNSKVRKSHWMPKQK